MKIKSIAAICKKNKNIAIFERYSDDGDILTQYIGDGSAVYPVIGLPPLDAESLLTIFDVPQRARIDGFVSVIDALTVRQKYYNEIGEMLKNAG